MDELWERTNALNAEIYKRMEDGRREEQRLRDGIFVPSDNGGGGNCAGGGSGGSFLFWMALCALGAVALHFM